MDALYQAQRGGLASSDNAWALQKAFLAHLEEIWQLPDRGIWESRRPPRHFTFSRVNDRKCQVFELNELRATLLQKMSDLFEMRQIFFSGGGAPDLRPVLGVLRK